MSDAETPETVDETPAPPAYVPMGVQDAEGGAVAPGVEAVPADEQDLRAENPYAPREPEAEAEPEPEPGAEADADDGHESGDSHVIERETGDPRPIEIHEEAEPEYMGAGDPQEIKRQQGDARAIERAGPAGQPGSGPQPIEAPGATAEHAAGKPVSGRRVRAVDFRRPTKFSRDQMRRLESAHDGFCRAASTRLSAELRTGVEIDVTTSDQLSYAAVMSEIPEEAIVTILDVDPIDTQVALIFELPLAVNLIDRLLGAVIARKTMPTGLTDLEAVVLQRVIRSIVEPLSATWQDLAGVRFSIAVAASTPANAQFAAPSEPCLLLRGEAHVDGTSSPIIFCLPHASVEPLMERLEKAHVRNRAVDDRATAMLRQAVAGVDVELRAEVGAVEMAAASVLALRPGDVLALRAPASEGVTILAGDVRSYMAAPGRNNAARAVQISGPCREAHA